MIGRLPTTAYIGGKELAIRTDYRDILLIIEAMNDIELSDAEKMYVLIDIFYKDTPEPEDMEEAYEYAISFIDCNKEQEAVNGPRLYDFEQDEQLIFSAVNKVAGREIRLDDYCHWWTFLGYFNEIGEGTFSTVVSIRSKKKSGKKLEKWEQDFLLKNKNMVTLKPRMTKEQLEEMNKIDEILGISK